jgi:hypothetical protein
LVGGVENTTFRDKKAARIPENKEEGDSQLLLVVAVGFNVVVRWLLFASEELVFLLIK